MKRIVTRWAYLNYDSGEAIDYTMLFSEQINEGWEIQDLSSAVDSYSGKPIIVLTALLTREG